MATSSEEMSKLSWRRYEDGDNVWDNLTEKIFLQDTSHKCPTYVHKTPPCQGSCPSGEDIRGWLQIVRGLEQPPKDMTWQEYAFRRSTDANPFPSMMGRVCPAPCQDGCNRNEVEDFVGINAVEQFIGDTAITNGYKFEPAPADTGKTVAVIGGGPAGLAAAYQLRRKGHAAVIFEANSGLGGMFRFGIPGYRVPRDALDAEINRILDMGKIEVKLNTKVGVDITVDQLEKDYDAVLWAIGCQSGRGLPVPGWDNTPNCVSGVAFLKAFNEGRMKVTAEKVVCVGGGDTSIDVVSVARRLGHISKSGKSDLPETVIHDGYVAHDAATTAAAEGATVTLTSLFERDKMTAAEHEVDDALMEGVTVLDGVMPTEVIKNDAGRAIGLKVADCKMTDGRPTPVEGTERVLDADLIVSAIGQGGELTGLEQFDNGRGLMNSDKFYQVPDKPGHFVAGDIIRPHLLTTAIGQAWIAVESIDEYLGQAEHKRRPKVDVHHFNLLAKLNEAELAPEEFKAGDGGDLRGTSDAKYAIHNYEDRSNAEVIPHEELYLGHFPFTPRVHRKEEVPSAEEVLGHFKERVIGYSEEEAINEAKRCMSCGMCFECDNCVIFCPQDAVFRVNKDASTTGRYVDTDYAKCIGCHICADVCPTGYIKMGLGE
ncbi:MULTISPECIES: NAD(P)-binding protein [Thiorhodovibrio]|uniref:NAD(P)-binding protein n=1 Tax=Thiorhodovibrio TaxID=61593 RepID=UPI0019147DC5|nr:MULTISPECIES: NAD(P)-binding protein [Thiorhodovibrio]MBK5970671.1 glutamate synthase [Thiorhodovibrio winogradskyi]WPL14215.1 Intracellular sulfur oxidation protein DsrK [Thiorhodovibrio litoralis]